MMLILKESATHVPVVMPKVKASARRVPVVMRKQKTSTPKRVRAVMLRLKASAATYVPAVMRKAKAFSVALAVRTKLVKAVTLIIGLAQLRHPNWQQIFDRTQSFDRFNQ